MTSSASMATRSTITIVRTLCRASSPKSTTAINRKTPFSSFGVPFRSSNFAPQRQNPISTKWLLLPRELTSFQPFHTAVASAYLVSLLPSQSTTSTQGRFTNYISPI